MSPKRRRAVSFEACCQWVLLSCANDYPTIYRYCIEVHFNPPKKSNFVNKNLDILKVQVSGVENGGGRGGGDANWNTRRKTPTTSPKI